MRVTSLKGLICPASFSVLAFCSGAVVGSLATFSPTVLSLRASMVEPLSALRPGYCTRSQRTGLYGNISTTAPKVPRRLRIAMWQRRCLNLSPLSAVLRRLTACPHARVGLLSLLSSESSLPLIARWLSLPPDAPVPNGPSPLFASRKPFERAAYM